MARTSPRFKKGQAAAESRAGSRVPHQNVVVLVARAPLGAHPLCYPGIRPMAAMISRESRRTIREDASTNRSSPLASTRAAGSQQSPPVWRRPPTARLAAPTHQNHGTAARISRQTDRTIREDASTNHSSPLASTRAVASLPFTLMSCPPAAR